MQPVAPVRGRRTQEERSADTRARLLDATIESLIEVGYAGTTTAIIAERAGLSRGAQVHHFPTKSALVASAVRHHAAQQVLRLEAETELILRTPDRLSAFFVALRSTFSGRPFCATLELLVAARTDPELRTAVETAQSEVECGVERLWHRITSDRTDVRDELLELKLHYVRGLGLRDVVRKRDATRDLRVWQKILAEQSAPSEPRLRRSVG